MAGYSSLMRVTDPDTRVALKSAFDQIRALQTELATLRATLVTRGTAAIDGGGLRLSNLADGTTAGDAATLGQVRTLVDQVKKATY